MKLAARVIPLCILVVLLGSACSPRETTAESRPESAATRTRTVSPTETTAPTETTTPEPSLTSTPALLDLEILEWSEWPYANPADPANTDTHVEVLIRNPNDFPVRVNRDVDELRFVNAAGEVVYTNPNPFFYIWQGEWMLPGETSALSACVCFWTSGTEPKDWESLELVAPLEIAIDVAYTLDVEVTLDEFFNLAEAHLGGNGLGAWITLTNTSDQALKSISILVLARDASGRYVGVATFGNSVVRIGENISIQPGETATGIVETDIDYIPMNVPLSYEVAAVGIISVAEPTAEPALESTPVADWQGIPIMPGAISGGESGDGYRFSTQAAIDEIIKFYEAALADLGYSFVTSGQASGVAFLQYTKGTATAIIGVRSSAGLNLVEVIVTP